MSDYFIKVAWSLSSAINCRGVGYNWDFYTNNAFYCLHGCLNLGHNLRAVNLYVVMLHP